MVDDGLYYTPHCGRESLRLFESWIGDTHKQFSKMLWYPFEMSNLTGSEHKREKSLGLCKSQERICVVYFPGESLTSRALCTKGSVLTLRQCTDSFFFLRFFFLKLQFTKNYILQEDNWIVRQWLLSLLVFENMGLDNETMQAIQLHNNR